MASSVMVHPLNKQLTNIYLPNALAIATFSKIAKRGMIITAILNFSVISPKLTYFSTMKTKTKNIIAKKFREIKF